MRTYQEEQEMMDELGAQIGDARRCPRHPGIKTSSDDGMFDGLCGRCEYESDAAFREEEQTSPTRTECNVPDAVFAVWTPVPLWGTSATCLDAHHENEILF